MTPNLLTWILNNNPADDFPLKYLLTASERPAPLELLAPEWIDIPTISLAQTHFNNLSDLQRLVNDVCAASVSYGMFQVVDHNVSASVLTEAMRESVGFFSLPNQQLEAFSAPLYGHRFLYSSSQAHASGQDTEHYYWRDALTLGLNSPRPTQGWPTQPPELRSRLWEFASQVKPLENRILSLINQGLGLRPNYFTSKGLNEKSAIVVNHYPLCPHPTWTCGMSRHADPNLLTISFQGGANGLQIWRDGEWKLVVPSRNALLVTLGRQMEIVSNGILKPAEHRVIVNSQAPRTSISYFSGPSNTCIVGPAEDLTRTMLPLYRNFRYGDFIRLHLENHRNTAAILPYFMC
ncbi:2'-deoxymugineic-acid 2'-dioxygenase-like [Silene latifolia]|uniref:2'-deoxymugineic-acid 2'-dioxygenase-like n=1 Tax=Silene latifolia TaxID=37657 RepID=UPI003D77628A